MPGLKLKLKLTVNSYRHVSIVINTSGDSTGAFNPYPQDPYSCTTHFNPQNILICYYLSSPAI